MKKYIIISLAALCAMCACTKVEPNQPADQAISFNVVNYASPTKADGDGSNAFLATGNTSFGVYAYYNMDAWNETTATTTNVYIDGDEVKHGVADYITKSNQDWATEAAYYWPKTGMLTFVGWAPKSKTATFDKTNGIQWANFAITTTPNATAALGTGNQIDLLYSDVAADQTANSTTYGHEGVPMLFHHALAKLNFNLEYDMTGLSDAQKAMFTIQVTDITFKTLGSTASFSNKEWGTPSVTTENVDLAGASNSLTSTSATQTGYVADYFIIPQTPVKLVVNYKINDVACTPVTIDLKTATIADWLENYIYTYTLKISPITEEPITFDPSVAAWEGPVTDSIDVE